MSVPDAVAAVRHLIREHDPSGSTYLHLTVDYQQKPFPAYLIYRNGGAVDDGLFRSDRLTVETYAWGLSAAQAAADAVAEMLQGPHDGPEPGEVIDRIRTDVVPVEVPQPAEFPTLVTATYLVETRHT